MIKTNKAPFLRTNNLLQPSIKVYFEQSFGGKENLELQFGLCSYRAKICDIAIVIRDCLTGSSENPYVDVFEVSTGIPVDVCIPSFMSNVQ
jgi:hypothetical protein